MVPKVDIVAEAVSMEIYVHERIGKQILITGVILVGFVLAIIVLAFILSRSVTENISKLVAAARRVASGDFATRVRIHSRDEIGELGRTFNNMVPALEDRVRMKQALDVAMEVQQNLLPTENPSLQGYDVSGVSMYCDQTGGDYYDYFPLPNGKLGITVADACGHGVGAAMLMTTVRAFLISAVGNYTDPAGLLNEINKWIDQGLSDDELADQDLPRRQGCRQQQIQCLTLAFAGHGSRQKHGADQHVEHQYIGNVPGSTAVHTLCPGCGKELVKRSGYRILNMSISEGKCTHCSESISGYWN